MSTPGALQCRAAPVFSLIPVMVFVAFGCGGGGSSSPPPPSQNPVPSVSILSPSSVTLTPTPASGSAFAGRGGACTGTGTCSVTMSAATSATATSNGPGAVSLSPASLFLGTQLVKTSSAPGTVTLTNTGGSPVVIRSITIAGANSSDFSASNNCPLSPSTLTIGAACAIQPIFTPSALGPRKSSIRIIDDAGGSPQTVILTGVGSAGGPSPTSLTFASQTLGTSSTPQTVTFTNKGSGTMNLWQIAILGANSGDFSQANTCGSTLGAGAGCTISVTFNPTATGARTASLLFSDDGGGSPQSVSLSGTGLGFTPPAWQAIGPRAIPNAHACDNTAEAALLAAGRIQAFAVNLSNPSIMYAGGGVGTGSSGPSSDAGVFASTNGGAHWTAVDNGLTDRFVDALWLDQSNPSTLLASTFHGGIFRSTDGGQSWTNVLSSPTTSIVQVSSTLLAAAAEGIVTSPDSGATWTLQQPTTSPVRTLACSGGACYAGLEDGTVLVQASPASGWVTSRSGGAGLSAYDVTVNPLNGLEAIVVLNNSGTLQNFVTQDGGKSWTTFNSPPMQSGGTFNCSGGPAKVVAFDTVNPNIIWAGFGGSIWVSLNGAGSWTPLHLYEDHNLLYPIPGKSGQVVVGGDQGIYMSQDTGATWTTLNGDLSTSLLNDIAVNGMEISTTVQDFSPIQSFDGGNTWLQLSNPNPSARPQGENGVVVIDAKSPLYQYFFNGLGFWYSSDGGNDFTNDNANIPPSEWTSNGTTDLIAVDPSNSQHVYLVGSSGIFQSTDFGVHWQPTGWPTPSPSFIAIDPNNPSTIFVGSAQLPPPQHPVLFTHDGGATWQAASLPQGAFWPVSLAVDPSNSSVVVLAMSGTPNQAGGGVLISTDGGATFSSDNVGLATYSNISEFQHYAWSVRFAPLASPDIAAVATSDGLFISKAGGPWTDISGNAIPQWFNAIAWDSGYLYAATYGQGVLRAPISQIIK